MPLLDQFRRPDRGASQVYKDELQKDKPTENPSTPASTSAAVAEDSLPNHASEEDAA